jgi:opacity protein-like surface antigen
MNRLLLTCALLLSTSALAAENQDQGDVNLTLRGGLADFTGDLAAVTRVGPSWGAALILQPTNVLGLEIAYEGSRNELDDARLASFSAITRHGASALLKIAPPFLERIKPFVGAGLGASRVGVADSAQGLYRSDIMEEIPLVAGLELNSGALTAGLRGTYRYLLDEAFAQPSQEVGNREGGLMDASLTLGARF